MFFKIIKYHKTKEVLRNEEYYKSLDILFDVETRLEQAQNHRKQSLARIQTYN